MGSDDHDVRGVQLGGSDPKALLLNDGTRLALLEDGSPGDAPAWTRVGDEQRADRVSVPEALDLAGHEHARYVLVRTRAEAAWMELISEWYALQAQRLQEEVDRSERELQAVA